MTAAELEAARVLDRGLPYPLDPAFCDRMVSSYTKSCGSYDLAPGMEAPSKYDGVPLAELRNLVPKLLAEIDLLRKGKS